MGRQQARQHARSNTTKSKQGSHDLPSRGTTSVILVSVAATCEPSCAFRCQSAFAVPMQHREARTEWAMPVGWSCAWCYKAEPAVKLSSAWCLTCSATSGQRGLERIRGRC